MSLTQVIRSERKPALPPLLDYWYLPVPGTTVKKWYKIARSNGASTDLGNISGTTFSVALSARWSPNDIYYAVVGSSSGHLILKRNAETSLTVLTSGVPAWSASKNTVAWADDDYLIMGGQSGTNVECATRSGDTFTMVSSPLSAQPAGVVWAVATNPDGDVLAVGTTNSGGSLFTYTRSGSTWTLANSYTIGSRTIALDFSPDGSQLATLTWDGTAITRIFNVSGAALTVAQSNISGTNNIGQQGAIRYSPNGSWLAAGSSYSTDQQTIYKVSDYSKASLAYQAATVVNISWSPDSRFMIASGSSGNYVYSVNETTGVPTFLSSLSDSSYGNSFTNRLYA